MAKRISSLFSLGSNYSDRTESSIDSRLPSSENPSRPPRRSSMTLAAKSTPELRPTNRLRRNQSSGVIPPFNPSDLPPIDDVDALPQPPQLLSPHISQMKPIGGGRPASLGSRPRTKDDINDSLGGPPPLLMPLPIRPGSAGGVRPVSSWGGAGSNAGSRPGSRDPSRPASPARLSRPQTPTGEQKLAKRRSWLPGRFRTDVLNGELDIQKSQASVITPQGKLPYDITPLANFQKVNRSSPNTFVNLSLTTTVGSRALA